MSKPKALLPAKSVLDYREQEAELTALLKRVDRLDYLGGTRWLYWEDDRKEWAIREEWRRQRRLEGRLVGTSPNLIDALKKLLEEATK